MGDAFMDRQLLENLSERLKEGDDSVITPIYQMTNRIIFSVAFSILKNEFTAQDVMQDTYIKMRASINSYESGTNFLAWLSQIARNFALMEYRKRKREVQIDPIEHEAVFGSVSMEFVEKNPVLTAAMQALEEDERTIVLLHINGDLKHREIADVVQKPLGTVLWIYNKALKKLKEYLLKNGGEMYE